MASKIPRVASSARQVLSQAPRTLVTRVARPARLAVFTHVQRRYASGAPHYDPAPPQIETILKDNHAEPHTAEDWKEIGVSALQGCSTQAEREAVQEYITNAVKPKLTDEEIIAVASQVGVPLTTPEHLAAGHAVFKNLMKAATIAEAEALFVYFERTGEFPADIKSALNEQLTKALASPPAAGHHDDHHDDHGHGHGAAHVDAKEGFGVRTNWVQSAGDSANHAVDWMVLGPWCHSLQLYPLPPHALEVQRGQQAIPHTLDPQVRLMAGRMAVKKRATHKVDRAGWF